MPSPVKNKNPAPVAKQSGNALPTTAVATIQVNAAAPISLSLPSELGGCVPPVAYYLGGSMASAPCRELTVCFSDDGVIIITHPLGVLDRCDMKTLGASNAVAAFLLDDPAPGAQPTRGFVTFDGDGTLRPAAVPAPVWIQATAQAAPGISTGTKLADSPISVASTAPTR